MDELDELIAFLDDSRPQVRQPAPRSAASIQVASAGGSCALCLSASSPHLPRCNRPNPPQIKQHAAELVQGLTGSPEGIAKLAGRSAKLLPPLFRLVPAAEATSRAALVALVNLSQVGDSRRAAVVEEGCRGCWSGGTPGGGGTVPGPVRPPPRRWV